LGKEGWTGVLISQARTLKSTYYLYLISCLILMSYSLSKPSQPSRAYLHLTSDAYLMTLSETVRQASFEDAQNTWTSPSLLGPPTVEFAPYGRIPSGRRRTDARQGTIDQDPEFMDFLESLANPVSTKEPPRDGDIDGAIPRDEKVTITPLVQFLKDKKANKGKEVAASKAAKHARQESAGKSPAKPAKESSSSPEDVKKSSKDVKKERLVEKAAREAVKVLTREAAAKTAAAQEPPKNPRAQARERGSIAAAARILQRDLGLSPVNAHRKAKADADNATKAEASSQPSAASTPAKAPASPAGKARAGRAENDKPPVAPKETPAPITLLKKPAEAAAPATPAPPATPTPPTAPAAMPNKAAPGRKPQVAVPSAGATRAFVKHANPSQGVTEPLLKEAMEAFGAVSHVEIDKRKGFAYVDFVEPEGLVKAMAANPTKIAQGTVQVLERKDPKPAAREPPAGPARGGFQGRGRGTVGRRGRGGGGGGPAAASNSPAGSSAPASAPTGPAASVK
jgi:regulator of nonsense transcripts 3